MSKKQRQKRPGISTHSIKRSLKCALLILPLLFPYILTAQSVTCEIPNCSFELWDSTLNYIPPGWIDAGYVQRVVSYDGSGAVQISSTGGQNAGAGVLALAAPSRPVSYLGYPSIPVAGGIPFAYRPDSILFHTRYDIVSGDTAWVIMLFTRNGAVMNTGIYPITGTTGGLWTTIEFPARFQTTGLPDSMLLGFASTNIFGHANGQSVLALDDITFPGTTAQIPDWNFEQWDSVYVQSPQLWMTNSFQSIRGAPTLSPLVDRVTDHISGQYAMQIRTDTTYENHGSGAWVGHSASQRTQVPTFAVTARHSTFDFYAKYFPEDHDSMFVQLTMFLHDTVIGGASLVIDTTVGHWTAFSININYGASAAIPDSASLTIGISPHAVHGNSLAYIDDLSFDVFGPTAISEHSGENNNLTISPNPAINKLTIYTDMKPDDITVFDPAGRSLVVPYSQREMDISSLAVGVYYLRIQSGDFTTVRRFVKE